MDISAIRAGIKANLTSISGLAVHTTAPATIAPPAVLITTDTPFIEYHTANAKGLCTLRFNLQVLVSRADERRAQEQLDQFLSAGSGLDKSIIDAMTADTTLGGAVKDSIILTAGEYFSVENGESSLGSALLTLTAYASRT